MEEVKIKYKVEVINYLNQLTLILYKGNYFSYLESAINYKNKIIEFIEESILIFPAQKTPINIQYLGSKYIFYKSNQRTTWYIFFEQKENNFVITNIINNNAKEVKWL
ncbi:MAG: hypothetical protein ACPG4Y_05175 [Chitinophagales bacterium]